MHPPTHTLKQKKKPSGEKNVRKATWVCASPANASCQAAAQRAHSSLLPLLHLPPFKCTCKQGGCCAQGCCPGTQSPAYNLAGHVCQAVYVLHPHPVGTTPNRAESVKTCNPHPPCALGCTRKAMHRKSHAHKKAMRKRCRLQLMLCG
jgi:hypothetical protein